MTPKLPRTHAPARFAATWAATTIGPRGSIVPMTCVGCRQIASNSFDPQQHTLCNGEDGDQCVAVRGQLGELCVSRSDIAELQRQAQDNQLIAALLAQFQQAAGRVCVTDRIIAVPVDNRVSQEVY